MLQIDKKRFTNQKHHNDKHKELWKVEQALERTNKLK